MGHVARLICDDVEVALLRNRIPLGWPLLLAADEVELLDRVEHGESFRQVRAIATGASVRERLERLVALGHPLFLAAERVVLLFEGVDEVRCAVDEIDALDDEGWTLEPLRRGEAVLAGGLVDLESIAEPLGWGWWLRDPEHRMATRLTGMAHLRETLQTLAFGYPGDAGPFEDWWRDGPPSPEVSTADEDASAFLEHLERDGTIRVHNPKWAQRALVIAMRTREPEAVLACLEAAESMGNLSRKRRWLGLADAAPWDVGMLTSLLEGLPR